MRRAVAPFGFAQGVPSVAEGHGVQRPVSRSSSSMRFMAADFNAAADRAIATSPTRCTCGTRRSRAATSSRSRRIVRASREGLAGVLFKPFKVEQLLELVEKAVGAKAS